jgi:hypothetical protein
MSAYFTVAVTTLCHFVPAVLMANTPKRWLPAPRLTLVLSCLLEATVYFFTPSTQSSIRAIVPLTVEAALTATGELTLEPFVGAQMCTPFADGALHAVAVGTTTRAFGTAFMVYGEPGTAVTPLEVTLYA